LIGKDSIGLSAGEFHFLDRGEEMLREENIWEVFSDGEVGAKVFVRVRERRWVFDEEDNLLKIERWEVV
jgi:hypothetical protein